jgi:hypothetical protein
MRVRTSNAKLQGDAKNPINIHVGGTTEPVFSNCEFEHARVYVEAEWTRAPFYMCIFKNCEVVMEDENARPFENCVFLGKDSEGRETASATNGAGETE